MWFEPERLQQSTEHLMAPKNKVYINIRGKKKHIIIIIITIQQIKKFCVSQWKMRDSEADFLPEQLQ